jgi:hypothetical protein
VPSGAWVLLGLLVGCADGGVPHLEVDPMAADLGEVPVGETATATIRIGNTGTGIAEIRAVSLTADNSRAWSVGLADTTDLFPGASSDVDVVFAPLVEGQSSAELEIVSNDPDVPVVDVPLVGTGGPSRADVDGDGASEADGDCDDTDPDVHPGAPEACDGLDDDCDGLIPTDEADEDGDGTRVCAADCDDTDPAVYPGAPELCDDHDDDCDGLTPDRADADADGFTLCDGDCDDSSASVAPGLPELCDGVDSDCSGTADDRDLDGDGHSPCDRAGDCDDGDPAAYPVYADPSATGAADGTVAAPYATLADAVEHLDAVCRTVVLARGTWAVSTTWNDGALTLRGGGASSSDVVLTPPAGVRALTVGSAGSLTLDTLSLEGARTVGADGGALFVAGGSATLSEVRVVDNSTTGNGGGIAVERGSLTLGDGCVLADNVAGAEGGAVAVSAGTFVDAGSTWTDNAARDGGALRVELGTLTIDDATFTGNRADIAGGAVLLRQDTGIAMEGGALTGNSAGGQGGALLVDSPDDADGWLRNLRVADNDAAAEGGGLALTGWSASLVVANNTFVGNAAGGEGGGVYISAGDSRGLTVWSNIVAWNDAPSGLDVTDESHASVAYTLAYGTSGGAEMQLGWGTDDGGNLVGDPLFVDFSDDGDPTDDTLTLQAGSPAMDAGPDDGTGPVGYRVWSDPDGTRNDRGCTGGLGG